ncbi:hypothetical protein HS1genome_1760 [Sulfodiicoccus acidiphilus]|uniref:CRISPR-associated protein Cas6 C-terminal domain-containing protein n=1 Tax=Sulfodiicoccus acidiphilus TaxID=1670455 RepID=A0A348B5B9_9CREN|nr:hypothetical protein [Sulfodiicoccus acidiphilus]BBD73371.1 hypothetical protein HS1genome_1760 [Sulfodiicoccus acidiphilus]GGU00977.1 hypothetical protein GCM10007116_17800 [Sulfodiicoccus acidiphilus]
MLRASITLRPENRVVLPPMTSKLGKVITKGDSSFFVSPVRVDGRYLFRLSKDPLPVEVSPGPCVVDISGSPEGLIKLLAELKDFHAFNTKWRIEDVKVEDVRVECSKGFELSSLSPVLPFDPYVKVKLKRFTNSVDVVLAAPLMDVTSLSRGDELKAELEELRRFIIEDPSLLYTVKVIYAGKEVVGMLGKLRYRILRDVPRLTEVLSAAAVRGVGSSRRNGFGRVEVRCYQESGKSREDEGLLRKER